MREQTSENIKIRLQSFLSESHPQLDLQITEFIGRWKSGKSLTSI